MRDNPDVTQSLLMRILSTIIYRLQIAYVMPRKFKIVFYNFMIFLILFDILYLAVWIFSVEMNPVKTIIVAGVTALLMPWARSKNFQSHRKVVIRSFAVDLFMKYHHNKIN